MRVNEPVLEKGAADGFSGMREAHGYIVQHLIESDRSPNCDAVRFSRRGRQTIEARLQRAIGKKPYDDAKAALVAGLEALAGLESRAHSARPLSR